MCAHNTEWFPNKKPNYHYMWHRTNSDNEPFVIEFVYTQHPEVLQQQPHKKCPNCDSSNTYWSSTEGADTFTFESRRSWPWTIVTQHYGRYCGDCGLHNVPIEEWI